ncbi:MAG: TetR/AcrR family transcriptional regulator [Actinomycetia bacterium]|nr:TetR/AcrR family transcriptional regulator [Actinomycetes bacterium]
MPDPAVTDSVVTEARGRPRQFDADEVLDLVVQLFWDKGYEATSVADISATTGLNKSSLYNAFGSKDALFERALGRYVATRSAMVGHVLTNGPAGLEDIEQFLELMESEMASDGGSRGCLAVNTSTELGYRDDGARATASHFRTQMRDAFGAALLRAEARGEIAPGASATYREILVTWMLGMGVLVRGGADLAEVHGQFEAARDLINTWRFG